MSCKYNKKIDTLFDLFLNFILIFSHSVIEDEEIEIAKAMKISEDVDDANVNAQNKNVYSVKDPMAYKYPRILLERILLKKKENETLSAELAELKKKAFKLNQQYRLKSATTSNEIFEIS